MRIAAAAVVLLVAACNPLAPQPVEGQGAGGACTADIDCGDGLACECGACATPSPVDVPPLCAGLDLTCSEPLPRCIESCTNPVDVGSAACVQNVEVCDDGVLPDSCDCLGVPPPGTVCDPTTGTFVCATAPAPIGGCYTNDCTEPAFTCADACDGNQAASNCVDGAMACDQLGWFPLAECGECVGAAPACLAGCASVVGTAFCVADEWSCAHILVDGGATTPQPDCPSADAGPQLDAGQLDAGQVDAGQGDAGPTDAGVLDAGAVDAGAVDAGQVDGGALDGGGPGDAGADLDAGPADGGGTDAG